jgi:hypothetical protein
MGKKAKQTEETGARRSNRAMARTGNEKQARKGTGKQRGGLPDVPRQVAPRPPRTRSRRVGDRRDGSPANLGSRRGERRACLGFWGRERDEREGQEEMRKKERQDGRRERDADQLWGDTVWASVLLAREMRPCRHLRQLREK